MAPPGKLKWECPRGKSRNEKSEMDGRCRAAVRNMASGLACSVMGQIGTAAWPQATAPASVVEHVVLVDARLWQESHEEDRTAPAPGR